MSKSTPTWMKVLGVFGVLALVGAAALVALGYWAKGAAEDLLVDLETDLPALAEEGVRYAASHTQAECVDAGLAKAVQCGNIDLPCQLGASFFGQSCIEAATVDPTLCEGVPVDEGSVALGTWAQERCVAAGHPDSTPCLSFHQQALVAYCRDRASTE